MNVEPREPQQSPATDGRLPLPRQTTPTWEIELLLSGAVVFALFQLPDPVHAWADALTARLGRSGDMVVRMGTVYALMVNYALIAMFLMHLTARAYWIALVGVDSVYPGGVRWENYRQGPIARAVMQALIPSTPRLIERADNFASLCFAFGLLVVLSALLGAVFALPAAVLAAVLSEWLFDGRHLDLLLFSLMGVLIAPLTAAGIVDKRIGKRLEPGTQPQGRLADTIAALYRMPINSLPAPLMLMVATNQRGRRGYALFFAALFALMLLLIADIMVRKRTLPFDGYDYLPEKSARVEAHPRYYREFRTGETRPTHVPSIDSQLASGDWLRLVVPYHPERHNALVERRCAQDRADARALAAELAAEPEAAVREPAERRVLDCLLRELDVRVDDAPVTGADAVFASDPDTGLRGLLVMVPVGELATGRHELSLRDAPRTGDWDEPERLERHEALGPLRIPFWR